MREEGRERVEWKGESVKEREKERGKGGREEGRGGRHGIRTTGTSTDSRSRVVPWMMPPCAWCSAQPIG